MLRIPIPDTAYSSEQVTLNGQTFIFTFRYNERSERWKLDIEDSFENLIIAGLTLVENISLTSHLNLLDIFDGDLYCVKLEAGEERLGRNNVGVGKTHELIYVGANEL
jgi:hypothetical protein